MQISRIEIRNFRGIKSLDLTLGKETVLVGENNTGKTSILQAFRNCLERIRSKKSFVFDEFDFHLDSKEKEPAVADPISITLVFTEDSVDAWKAEIVRSVGDFVSFLPDERREIRLNVQAKYDSGTREFVQQWAFLDASGNPMTGKASNPNSLNTLQNLCPIFYLSALRDAGKEFSKNSAFWGSFIRRGVIAPELKSEIEAALNDLNLKVVESHASFEYVLEHLSKMEELLKIGHKQAISIEALPGRLFDLLSKAQVNICSTTGASLPIARHGEGTQSIAVLLLFDAFLKASLLDGFDKNAVPIVALEEPEAHLHPCAVRTLWKTIKTLEGQKIVSSHSGDLIAEVPLDSIRRLYRKNGTIEVGRVLETDLTSDERRKFDFHVKRSRGEMIFANCWILVEGETEDVVLRESARILGIDIERLGIRIVGFQNGGGLELYLKVATKLGIGWICLLDGDAQQGAHDRAKAEKYLGGRNSAETIFQSNTDTIELFLCESGYGDIYEALVTTETKSRITINRGDPGYWKQVIDAIPTRKLKELSKPGIALDVMKKVDTSGSNGVPDLIRKSLEASTLLAGGNSGRSK